MGFCLISLLERLKVISISLQAQRSCTMEEYEGVEGNALIAYEMSDATDATAATTGGQRQGVEGQDLQVNRQAAS